MQKNLVILILLLTISGGISYYLRHSIILRGNQQVLIIPNSTTTNTVNIENMDLILYIQDKAIAATSDCSITKKTIVKVPKTVGVADASLNFLFSDELKAYGIYKSVEIASGTAKVMLESDMTPTGSPIVSLSSCESGHLLSVLKDTLTQYDSIKTVKLYSSKGEIIF